MRLIRRLIIALTLLIVLTISLRAQDDDSPRYRLRVPSAEEYLNVIVESASEVDIFPSVPFNREFDRLTEAFFYLYPDFHQTTFDALFAAYTEIAIGERDLINRGAWVRPMVMAWIVENAVDLSQTEELKFEDFYIEVTPRDFNTDGVDEYLLDVMKGKQVDRQTENCLEAELIDYMIIQQTAQGYRYIDTKIPWRGQQAWFYSSLNGGIVELRFADLNADSLPEWVVLVGGEFAGGFGMGSADAGSLLILGWRDDGFKHLVPTSYSPDHQDGEITTDFLSTWGDCGGPFPATVEWEFTNIDGDAPLEILQAQYYFDNWSCKRTETKVFDWSPTADRYTYVETRVEYATHTQNCVQREAEAIMWTDDYSAAIPLFEQALNLETYDLTKGDTFIYERSLHQYLWARLALAYIMTDQGELADPLLETLADEEAEEETIAQFVETLITARRQEFSNLQLCSAVYNLFTTHFLQIRVGYTGDDLYYGGNPYTPEQIGCDAPAMLTKTIDSTQIPVELSPVDYLAQLGITTLRSLETDLNDDGQSERLVWPDVAGSELFFAPGDDFYVISHTSIDRFLQSNDFREITFLGQSRLLATITPHILVNTITPWDAMYSPIGGSLGGTIDCSFQDGSTASLQVLTLWQLQDQQLVPIFSELQCGTSLDEIFEGNKASETLILNITECLDDFCSESITKPVSYSWDSAKQTYVPSSQPTQTPEPTATPEFRPTPTPQPYPQYFSVLDAFEERDFVAVVGMTAEVFAIDAERDLNDQLGDFYLRALALEALDRPGEALAEYVALYEAVPESAWGRLAALHLEVVE